MKINKELLEGMGVSESNAAEYVDDLQELLPKYGITDSKTRLAHFLSQVLHESGMMRYDTENLNYSAKALRAVFGKYFKTQEEADAYARKKEEIANRVYASRMGNGDEVSGDGWRYRGRGLMQLTGKDNYKAFSEWLGEPRVLTEPELVASDYAVASAVFYWDRNKLNAVADQDDIKVLTKRINGGYNGLEHRQDLYAKAAGLLAQAGSC